MADTSDLSEYEALNNQSGPSCAMKEVYRQLDELGERAAFDAAMDARDRIQGKAIVRRLSALGIEVTASFIFRHREPVQCVTCRRAKSHG